MRVVCGLLLTAWAACAAEATITVRPQAHLARIDPNIYGHFAEMCFRVFNGGLWAEMLEARKFEGRDGDSDYGVVRPWRSLGRTGRTHFAHDNTVFYSGRQSQKITSREPSPHETGVAQGGLYCERGKAYQVRVNLRQQGLTGPVVVALEGPHGTYASRLLKVGEGDWQRFSFSLRPAQTDRDARFSLKFSGPGTLWLGAASLMPEDHVSGYRRDVVEALRQIKVPHLRWPGGNFVSYYRWEDGLGDRDRRPARLNLSRAIEQEGRYWEPNDAGIDEFMELCRLIGAQPFLAVNAGDGTPEEAARLVEYANGAADTKYGARRAANGHPQPYGVKLWSIGNEIFGDWQGGHVDEETHARRVVAFAQAMRAVDPGIKLVASGARAWFYPRWNQALLETAAGSFDYLSLHSYARKYRRTMKKADLKDPAFAREFYYYIVSGPFGIEEQIVRTAQEIREALPNGPAISIAFDEWNAWAYRAPNAGYGDHEVDFAARDGVYAAGVLHAFRRQHRSLKLASYSMTVNALPLLRVNRFGLFFTPQYLVFKLYMNHQGPVLVASQVQVPDFSAPEYEAGRPLAPGRIPYLDVSATTSVGSDTLYLAVINLHDAQAIAAQIRLEGWSPKPDGKALWIDAEHYMTENTFAEPERVRIRERPLAGLGPSIRYEFPPHSVTVLEMYRR